MNSPTVVRGANIYKLMSRKGTLLGTITLPDAIAEILSRRSEAVMQMMPPLQISFGPQELPPNLTPVKQVVFHESYYLRGALEFWGVTLEELEQFPGVSFSPSAAYFRSMVEKE